jgi:hypothetical protein
MPWKCSPLRRQAARHLSTSTAEAGGPQPRLAPEETRRHRLREHVIKAAAQPGQACLVYAGRHGAT